MEFQSKIFGIFNESIKLRKTTRADSQELNEIWFITVPARWDPLICLGVTFWYQDCAGKKHQVLVAVGLNQSWEKGRLPADRSFLLCPVAQVVWVIGIVVRQVHTKFQSNWFTLTFQREKTNRTTKDVRLN